MKCVYMWENVFSQDQNLWKGDIVRISDDLARELVVDLGVASYRSKSAYKRDLERGGLSVQYIYAPNNRAGFKSARTVELHEDNEGLMLGDYNADGDLCGVEIIGDVDPNIVSKFTNW